MVDNLMDVEVVRAARTSVTVNVGSWPFGLALSKLGFVEAC